MESNAIYFGAYVPYIKSTNYPGNLGTGSANPYYSKQSILKNTFANQLK